VSREPDDDLGVDLPPVEQRQVSASEAPLLSVTAASSVFNWRGRGQAPGAEPLDAAAADEREPAPAITLPKTEVQSPFRWRGPNTPPLEVTTRAAAPAQPRATPAASKETTMVKPQQRNGAARSRKTARGSPQLHICSVLLQGDLTFDAIGKASPKLQRSQIYSALNNARQHQRITVNSAGAFQLTNTGKEWVKAAGVDIAPAPQPKPAPTPPVRKPADPSTATTSRVEAPAQQRALAPATVDTSPMPAAQSGVRFALDSDGRFWITKNGVVISLEGHEFEFMEKYMNAAHLVRALTPKG
jgi:hypothetical protein